MLPSFALVALLATAADASNDTLTTSVEQTTETGSHGTVNSTFETQLEKLLETSGDLTLIEIRQKVDELVANTNDDTRKRHELWKVAQHARDNIRRRKIKDALLSLSREAQARLIRIILIQEDEELTQNEKRARLNEIARSLTPAVRTELVEKLRDSSVLTDFSFF